MSKTSCCTSCWSFWPKEFNGSIDNTIGIMQVLVTMVTHDQNSHVPRYFDHLDLRNAKVSLMVLSTSHDTDTKCSGIIWHQCQWHHMILMLMPMHHTTKMSWCITFWFSWHKESSGAIAIKYCHHQYQWHHMTKKAMSHLILIILSKQMQLYHCQCHKHHMMPMPAPNASCHQKVMFHLISTILTKLMQWWH